MSDNRHCAYEDFNEIIAPCGLRYIKDNKDKKRPYKLLSFYRYNSKRYNKTILLSQGNRSDGATGALDIPSCGWWVHDALCNSGQWEDGTRLTNWQCSTVLHDILKSEKRYIRSIRWFVWTFLFGGGECRKNGMIKLKGV